MQALAEQVHAKQNRDTHQLVEERKRKNYADFWNPVPVTEPFRVVLSDVRDRLYHTRQLLHHCLMHQRFAPPATRTHNTLSSPVSCHTNGAEVIAC